MRRLDVTLLVAVIVLLACMQCSEEGPGEVITKCVCPTGPSYVDVGSVVTYHTGGATSSEGHQLEYQFSWGDGTASDWSLETSAQHSWDAVRTYEVMARARCLQHADRISPWSDAKSVQVGGAPAPEPPEGATSACLGDCCVYSIGRGNLSADKTLEIQFSWDSDGLSEWNTALTREHTWSLEGTYGVKARTRFAGYNDCVSEWSGSLTVAVVEETVSAPDPPEGPSRVCPGETKTYCAKGARSSCCNGGASCGHKLEYRFAWGNDRISDWSSSNCASNAWVALGSYQVRAQARCTQHAVESPWSDPTVVTVDETISAPNPPRGPTDLCVAEVGDYSTDEVSSSCIPKVEYQFDWGDGTTSPWSASPGGDHAWSPGGTYAVTVRARSAANPTIASEWSSPTTVRVSKEVIPTPPAPRTSDGGTTICLDEPRTLCTDEVTSSCGPDHPIEYQFSWGDGTLSQWSSSPCFTHQWSLINTYEVKVRARCGIHTDILSAWSLATVIDVREEEITKPRVPVGPTCGCPSQVLTFSTGDAASSCGHPLEYAFDWGDGSPPDYQPSPTQSHSWSVAGIYQVKARARCATHKVESDWSDPLTVRIGIDCENISRPDVPIGPSSGCPGESMTFRTGGSQSSCGHSVEYRFNWDDGTYSNWTQTGIAAHAWTYLKTYNVKAEARCVSHPTRVSPSSQALAVTVNETVSTPDTPSGPPVLCVGEAATYTSGGARSSCNHTVEYFFDWGDGGNSGWVPAPSASYAWSVGGTYQVSVRAKCKDHDAESGFSSAFTVRVFNQKSLEIGWTCAGGIATAGNYPGNHLPVWANSGVTYSSPTWSDCNTGSGACQAVFEPRYGAALAELDDPDPAIAGVYIGSSTDEIKITLTADFRHWDSSRRKIIVTVGTCSWEITGSTRCDTYERTFRRADGCFSGSAVRVRLEVPDIGILHSDAAVSTLRLDFTGWCD